MKLMTVMTRGILYTVLQFIKDEKLSHQVHQLINSLIIAENSDGHIKFIKVYQVNHKDQKNLQKPLKAYISANNFHLNLVKFFNLNVLGRTR